MNTRASAETAFDDLERTHTRPLQAINQQGKMSLFLLHIHTVGTSAVAICLERLPASRHLTPRPGHHNHVHSFSQDVYGPAHTPFMQSAAAAGSAASMPTASLLLSGLVAIPCSAADVARVQQAAAVAGAAGADMALSPNSDPITFAMPAPFTTTISPFHLPLGLGSPERQPGGAGAGPGGVGQLSPMFQADVELLQAIFAEAEKGTDPNLES